MGIFSPIHQKIKDKIIASSEKDTVHIFRTLHNSARVFKNKVSQEVVAIERKPGGAKKGEALQPSVLQGSEASGAPASSAGDASVPQARAQRPRHRAPRKGPADAVNTGPNAN